MLCLLITKTLVRLEGLITKPDRPAPHHVRRGGGPAELVSGSDEPQIHIKDGADFGEVVVGQKYGMAMLAFLLSRLTNASGSAVWGKSNSWQWVESFAGSGTEGRSIVVSRGLPGVFQRWNV